ncbi:SpoIIE family protein phosphatase [Candidatus Woesearchaeota archaeon]|nr:SpoIIE family protein phosphatase [Candidatus Woesearchaeota archaeon]
MAEIFITETQGGFKPQTSMLDAPYMFETSIVKGAVFYLPFNGDLGADTFVIRAKDSVSVSLVGDMQGHGSEDRKKILPFLHDLEHLSQLAVSSEYNIDNFVKEIISMDQKADCTSMDLFSLSFVRVLSDGSICYLNEGENRIIIYSDGKLCDNSEELSHGKIGLLKLTMGSVNQILNVLRPYKMNLKSGDRVFLCSDGVIGFSEGSDEEQRLSYVHGKMAASLSLQDIIQDINKQAYSDLSRGYSLADDYSLIGIELK